MPYMIALCFALLVAITFASCTTAGCDDIVPQHVGEAIPLEQLYLEFDCSDLSRVELREGRSVWSEGDCVSVYNFSNVNQRWMFDGQSGDRFGSFSPVDTGGEGRATEYLVVLYPYSSNYWLNSRNGNVDVMFAEVQHYKEDSFGVGSSIMVAMGDANDALEGLKLRNVCGWLRLHLVGSDKSVASIRLWGNDGEQLAGRAYLNAAYATLQLVSQPQLGEGGDVGGTLIFPGDIVEVVTLECGGVELGVEAKSFYFALPPISLAKGFTVEICCADGTTMTRSTTKRIDIVRNHIHPMREIVVE